MSDPLTEIVACETKETMELIYGLRACGVERDIEIPQVAVIGDQSCGKSSVLEAICSIPLPRGAGLTTRCAIELRINNSRPKFGEPSDINLADGEVFWNATIATSLETAPITLNGIHALEDAIAERARSLIDPRRTGGFSKERIIVQISASGAPNLTIIDLPGMIRTKTFGINGEFTYLIPFLDRQDRSAIKEVSKVIQDYAAQERTIMLVVVPATQDVATIEALEWASLHDPNGKRTIGVITKPDLIDVGGEGEVAAVLSNKRKPLKLGYVMVKNRNQRQMKQNISVQEARKNEEEFFENHPIFSKMDRSLFGVQNLVKKLTNVLVSRVYDTLPSMRNEISSLLEQSTRELEELGVGSGDTPAEINMALIRIIFEYNNLLTEASAGRYVDKRLWDFSLRLCTRVRELYDHFKENVEKKRPSFESDPKFIQEVESNIRNSRGRELPGFLNPRIFESRVARYTEDWREDSNKLVTDVRRLVAEVATNILLVLAPEFPRLRQKIQGIVGEVLISLEAQARMEIAGIFEREIGQPFTMNEQFLAAVNSKRLERFDAAVVLALSRAGKDNRGNVREKNVSDMLRAWFQSYYCSGSSQRFRAEAEDMATILGCYWDISVKRFIDNHVMVLDASMIRPLAQKVHVPVNELVLTIGTSKEALEDLLKEDIATVSRRKALKEKRDRLKKAKALIDRF